jgi:hypothetical protein
VPASEPEPQLTARQLRAGILKYLAFLDREAEKEDKVSAADFMYLSAIAYELGMTNYPHDPSETFGNVMKSIRLLKASAGITWSRYEVTDGAATISEREGTATWRISKGTGLEDLAHWLGESEG